MKLLSMNQRLYLTKILNSKEHFKKLGKKYVSVESSIVDNIYRVYLLDDLSRGLFDGEIIEYVEL